jgi:hypothetical protein
MPQLGLFNWNQNNFSTLQTGIFNFAGGAMNGAQIGLINTTAGVISGVQIGLINYADSVEEGIPIGLLSIVKKGGYKAIELGASEIAPFNLSFKIGVEQFYTSFVFSNNPFRDTIREWIILGIGFGSIIRLNETFFINPEITSHYTVTEDIQHYLGVTPYIGYNIIPNLSIVVGPSLTWAFGWDKGKEPDEPFYNMLRHRINNKSSLYLGTRMAFRFRW